MLPLGFFLISKGKSSKVRAAGFLVSMILVAASSLPIPEVIYWRLELWWLLL